MDYNGLNAKIKAMNSRLFDAHDYDALSRLKSVEEVNLALKEYPAYQEPLNAINGTAHRDIVEEKLLLSLHNDYGRIYNFVSDFNVRRYLDGFFLRNEIYKIKILLSMIYSKGALSCTQQELQRLLGKKYTIDFARLLASKTVSAVIESLEHTVFYPILHSVYQEGTTLFALEMQLDLFYHLQLWKLQNRLLDKKNKKIMASINGTEIDLRNITWVYRLKTYYKLPPTIIYTHLIPLGYRLKPVSLNRMAQARSTEELLSELSQTPYHKLMLPENKQANKIEDVCNQEMNRIYRVFALMHPDSLAVAIGYMHFKKLEIKNITSLLEGVRYGLTTDEIMKYMQGVSL